MDTYAVLASAVYLGEGNLPYAVPVFRVLHGELEPTEYVQSIRGNPLFCSGSSCEWKIRNIFRKLDSDEERRLSEIFLVCAFLGAAAIIKDKLGSDNTAVEAFFSIIRMVGLKPRLTMNSMCVPLESIS